MFVEFRRQRRRLSSVAQVRGDVAADGTLGVLLFFVASDSAACPRGRAMKNFALKVKRFLVTEDGPTAVEYAVMLALILVVIIAAVANIGGTTSDMYNDIALQGVKVK